MTTPPDVRALVAQGRLATDVETAGAILGRGRTRAFEMARDGSLPGVRKLGHRYVVSLAELCAFLAVPFPALGVEGVNHDDLPGLNGFGKDESAPSG